MQLTQSLLDFLSTLAQNNHREWFTLNKPVFQKELAHFKLFSDELYLKMETFDLLEGKNVFRIYRDVRFSKDKLPYKCQVLKEADLSLFELPSYITFSE